jgi:flagellin
MPSVINTNLASMFAQKSLSGAQGNLATAVQRLSSGLRINSAKDDAAGLSVAQNMQSQINAINMAARNINDATNMLTTADSSLGTIQDILLRMKALVVEGKNDSLSNAQRGNIYTELNELNTEINAVSVKTTFNGNALLTQGSAITATGIVVGTSAGVSSTVSASTYSSTAVGAYTFSTSVAGLTVTSGTVTQTLAFNTVSAAGSSSYNFAQFGIKLDIVSQGADTAAQQGAALTGKVITITGSPNALGFQSGSANSDTFTFQTLNTQTNGSGSDAAYTAVTTGLNLISSANTQGLYNTAFNTSSTNIDAAINAMNTQRATMGAQMNRLGYTSSALMSQATNMSQSRSAIIDTDFAAETAGLTKGQIMQQAATAMLAQANQMPNVILSLLK